MAVLTLAKRLQKTLPPLSLSSTFRVTARPYFHSLNSSLSSFHQTLGLHSHTTHQNLRFSSLHPFPTQTHNDPFQFLPRGNPTHSPNESGLLELLKRVKNYPSEEEAMAALDGSGIDPNPDSVFSAIWALRDEWKLGVLCFKWGEKCGCCCENVLGLVVWVLGTHRKFNTAWGLIRDSRHSLIDTRQAMFIMIDRYAAANYPNKSIKTFNIIENLKLSPDLEAFHALLTALCKHGNIEEAEEFMLQKKKFFPLDIQGFNILLNGWCNISIDILEVKRVWREMSKYCITPNATSYTHMISSQSKVGNLFDTLRLYDEMKKREWVPGIEVYNSLIYVLTRENCLNEALKIVGKLKEMGLKPDCVTYNSMIIPLCEAKKLCDARALLGMMIGDDVKPTIETYHSILEAASFEATFEVLEQMRKDGVGPNGETFYLGLVKYFKLGQPENAMKIWAEMKGFEILPSRVHYSVLVEGLVSCGLKEKAREFYAEMKSNGCLDDPKLKKLLKEDPRRDVDKGKILIKRDTLVRQKSEKRMRGRKRRNGVSDKTPFEKANPKL